MIDLGRETPLSLTSAARMVPPGRRGRPVTLSCIFRWITKGVMAPDGQRVRLEASRLGGRWITSLEALQRFVDAQTPRFGSDATDTPRHKRRGRKSDRVDHRLDSLGI